MKSGKALLSMIAGFAAGTMLGALFVNKKKPKPTKEEESEKDKS
jgi:hypothetical protein